MRSEFDNAPRTFAFPLTELVRLDGLVTIYGADLPDVPKRTDSPTTRCLCGGLDREGSDDLRSLDHPTTASTTPLTDGRHAYRAYWSLALLAALDSGDVTGEELTDAQLAALRQPDPEL